jgi:SNF2 family DNA or RNA helicase
MYVLCYTPCRLLLRNHEALSALEASVTNSSSGAKQIVGEGNAWRRLLNLIMQLRKVVNHPFMLPDSEPQGEGTSSLQELLEASGAH